MNTSKRNKAKMAFSLGLIARERTMVVIFLTTTIALAVAFTRPDRRILTGMYVNAFKRMRARWHHCADVVIGGDSRIGAGVSPQVMRESIGDQRILNYGFAGNGFSDVYCNAIENILAPDAEHKIIVLGITPSSLTEGACRQGSFTDDVLDIDKQTHLPDELSRLLLLFRPFSSQDLRDLPHKDRWYIIRGELHPDGWSEAYTKKPDFARVFGLCRLHFGPERHGPVSTEIVDGLMERVASWKQKGIEVYGFRPPTCLEMVRIESKQSRFSEREFIARFQEAGGTWFDFDVDAYPTRDGSHLQSDAALIFSRELAERISRDYQTKKDIR